MIKKLLVAALLISTIQIAQAQLPNSYTGSWYDLDFDGAGFVVETLPDSRAVVYWFTYDDLGNQQWFIGVGETTDTEIIIDELLQTSGGVFGENFDPDLIVTSTVGSANFRFTDCAHATVTFEVDGTASEQQLIRLTGIRDLDCESSNTAADPLPYNQTGSWFNPMRSGEGFIVEVLDETRVLVDWFTYDPNGNLAWLTGIGHMAGGITHIEDMLITRGGNFGAAHDPDAVEFERWGQLELQLGCETGRVVYDSAESVWGTDWGQGSFDLERLSTIRDLTCIEDIYDTPASGVLIGNWISDGFGWATNITETVITLYQYSSSHCITAIQAPTDVLLTAGTDVLINQSEDRIRVDALDSVTPVDFIRATQLPAVCLNGGTGVSSDPQRNFDVFWETFDEYYAVFEARGVDWDAARTEFAQRIQSQMTEFQLFSVFSDMLELIGDPHTSVTSPNFRAQPDAGLARVALFQRSQDARVDVIIDSYLQAPRLSAAEGVMRYGLVNNQIGYLEVTRLSNFLADGDGDDRLAFIQDEADKVIQFFNQANVESVIVDIRRNDGGDSAFGLEIASRFSRGETRLAYSERRPVGDQLTNAVSVTLAPTNKEQFDGEVVLLTSRLTASAAEIMAFGMHALPHVTTMGGPTFGVLSRTERILPNGWTISITAGLVEAPNGERYEVSGIPVEISVTDFSSASISTGEDSGLETAIGWLQ